MRLEARVHSFESCGGVDGPGLRLVVFFQGCLLKCLYCHNRDTWDRKKGGELISLEALIEKTKRFESFMKASGGGVTASGGEATLQAPFVAAWFKACKAMNIPTCLDTNGFLKMTDPGIIDLLEQTDLVLLDIKQMNNACHKQLTGVSNKPILKFAKQLNALKKKMWIRYVVVPGYTDDPAWIEELGHFLKPLKSVERIELHPYHQMGQYKWKAFNEPYPLKGVPSPTKEQIKQIQSTLEQYGFPVDC